MSSSRESLAEELKVRFGEGSSTTAFGRTLPRVDPDSEAAVLEVLRFAEAERKVVLPLGFGSKLSWTRSDGGADLVLGTRQLSGVVAYEPGDGTITVRAGTTMAELSALVAKDGFALSPDVPRPENATLGGVVAAGQSGCDRPKTGPVRHHVLGARVALAEGTIVRSGGRLVKNVTGYDLHRLHCGAFGTLGLLTEVSLRLLPAPQCRRAFAVGAGQPLESLLPVAHDLRAKRLSTVESLRVLEQDDGQLDVTLSGLAAQVDRDLAVVGAVAASLPCDEIKPAGSRLRELRDAPAMNGGPLLHGSVPPSKLERSVLELKQFALDEGVAVDWLIEAETAELGVFVKRGSPHAVEAFVHRAERALRPLVGARVHLRNLPSSLCGRVEPFGAPAGLDWMTRLKLALDPEGRFGEGRLWPAR